MESYLVKKSTIKDLINKIKSDITTEMQMVSFVEKTWVELRTTEDEYLELKKWCIDTLKFYHKLLNFLNKERNQIKLIGLELMKPIYNILIIYLYNVNDRKMCAVDDFIKMVIKNVSAVKIF